MLNINDEVPVYATVIGYTSSIINSLHLLPQIYKNVQK